MENQFNYYFAEAELWKKAKDEIDLTLKALDQVALDEEQLQISFYDSAPEAKAIQSICERCLGQIST